ncbi:MAG: M23 family metallopeptidase [Devosia sp.]
MSVLKFLLAALTLGTIAIMPVTAAETGVVTPLIVETIAAVQPFVSADGATHLVYELLLINQSTVAVTVDSLAVLDEAGNALTELDGAAVARMSRVSFVGGSVAALEPSQSSFVFLDVTVPRGDTLPTTLNHRFVVGQTAPAEQGSINLGGIDVAAETGPLPDIEFTAAPVSVRDVPAVALASPVHGEGWVAFRSCCDLMSSHRGNTVNFNGNVRITERFAIDFVRLDATSHMVSGPGNEVESYVYYGEKIYAVADGVVIAARNNQPTQTPGILSVDITDDVAGGNAVIIDISNGHFAFYAHMQQGSVTVKAGDVVKAGDLIGLLGNSGKTVGPHLHFHLTDSPSTMNANGVPFVFAALSEREC